MNEGQVFSGLVALLGIVGLVLFLLDARRHRQKMNRMAKFSYWVQHVAPKLEGRERSAAQLLIAQIFFAGPRDSYRGPWEELPDEVIE